MRSASLAALFAVLGLFAAGCCHEEVKAEKHVLAATPPAPVG